MDRGVYRIHWAPPAAVVFPCLVGVALIVVWDLLVRASGSDIFPGPWEVGRGIAELVRKGLLLKYVVASLFRVTWGFLLAVLIGVPLGLFLGWFRPAYLALNPWIQVLRPISPIAWIPIAIILLGVGDHAATSLIFLGALFPIVVACVDGV